MFRLLSVFALAWVLAVAGCGGAEKTAVPGEEGAKKEIDLRGVPREFQYPGAEAVSRSESQSGSVRILTVVFETTDSLEKVSAFFGKVKGGWDTSFSQESDAAANFVFTKDRLEASVSVIADDNKQMITVGIRRP